MIQRHRGEFEQSLAAGDELVHLGREAGDRQVLGWGLLTRGATLQCAGRLEEAIASLREAKDVFLSIPADAAAVEASGFLAQCHIAAGRLDDALAAIAESERLIARRRLSGHHTISTLEARVWVALLRVEGLPIAERPGAVEAAAPVLRALDREGRAARAAVPRACRLRGTLEWLRGRTARAAECWRRSLAAAEALGARYDLGQTYLERGLRRGVADDLVRAEAILTEIGVTRDVAKAREALRH